jgi:hypothetical protein
MDWIWDWMWAHWRHFTLIFVVLGLLTQVALWYGFAKTSPGHATPTVLIAFGLFTLLFMLLWAITVFPIGSFLMALAATALGISNLIVSFATWYLSAGTRVNWNIRLSHTDALLVALGTFTTAGTNGITAETEYARRLITIQMAIGVVATIVLFGLLVSKMAMNMFRHRRPLESP